MGIPRINPAVLLACLLLPLGGHLAQAQTATAHLTLQSQPGDYIGQGQSFDITYTMANSYYFSAQVRRSLPSGEPAELLFVLGTVGSPNTFALLFFGTDQLGIPMQPGTYTDAQRADFASPGHPGLDVSFQNRGSNMVTGNFTVTEFTYSTAGIQSFAVSFEQHSEGSAPALFGTFTYQAIPEPGTLSLVALSAAGATGVWLRRRRRA